MNRKVVGGLLVSFFVLFVLIVISLFVPFGAFGSLIYTLFLIEMFYFTWVATRKMSVVSPLRKFVGGAIISFVPLLVLTIINLVIDVGDIENVIYFLFAVDFLFLFVLFARKSIRNFKSRRLGKEIEKETPYEKVVRYIVVYGVPLAILGYVLYFNVLPFGFEKSYVIDVGSKGDTTVTNELYLERNSALSEPIQKDGGVFRNLQGSTNLVFKPKAVLGNAKIEVEINGDNVFIVPPSVFDYSKYDWNLSIDFSKGIPDFLIGNPQFMEGCAYFDGQSKLDYPETHNQFEKGHFAVYAEWTPDNSDNDFQQIIGHFNWELLQEPNRVLFQIGRMNGPSGGFYSIEYPIDPSFFNKKHSALAVYSPNNIRGGYIEFFIDNKFIERKYIGNDAIWEDYSRNPLSIGKSNHGIARYYGGCIHKLMFGYFNIDLSSQEISFITSEEGVILPIVGNGNLYNLSLYINQK